MNKNLRSDATDPTLSTLPLEILLQIQGYLSTHEAALFSLTNKSVWLMLGSNAMLKFRGDYRETVEARKFLVILERDLPGYYACHECLVFHHINRLPSCSSDLNQTPVLPCMKYDMQAEQALFASNSIHYLDLYNAITNRGAQGAILQGLSVRTKDLMVDFAVQSNEILMRGQHLIKCSVGHENAAFHSDLQKVHICEHIRVGGFGIDLGDLTHCSPERLKSNTLCDRCGTQVSCPLCPTEFQSHLIFLSEADYVFVITRWLNFGNCISPNEPHYRSHMRMGSFYWINGRPHPLVICEPGSIKTAFENACQDGALLPYQDAASRFAKAFAAESQSRGITSDLSWFKLEIS